jgi:hypothetical protein
MKQGDRLEMNALANKSKSIAKTDEKKILLEILLV